jgi:hypothetical protein
MMETLELHTEPARALHLVIFAVLILMTCGTILIQFSLTQMLAARAGQLETKRKHGKNIIENSYKSTVAILCNAHWDLHILKTGKHIREKGENQRVLIISFS